MKKYYYISLKWTHKNDAFITFWGPNQSSYQWYKSWIGVYNKPYKHDPLSYDVFSVEASVVDELFVEVRFDNKDVFILPNTKEVRKKIGMNKNMLRKKYRSHCPEVQILDQYILKTVN